jgi:bifunctional enzyme CysN/CysC
MAALTDGMDLLRFTTAGSVDDGKSTLIGRLLYDTKSIFEDQMAHIEGASQKLGETRVNLALLTDGLRAEREQKITIDVAYRYFATPRRKFIIADTPGHIQYTRNMVTGASTADLAIILVDASKGVLTQSRRHAFITSLLGIPHLVVAVNKMDLVGYSQATFDAIVREFSEFAAKLTVKDISFVPLSALEGDNVVTVSPNTPWYQGGPLLHRLETVNVGARTNAIDFRFPVQYIIRPNQSFRGYAGTVASGSVRPGEQIVVLPSGFSTRIKAIQTYDGPVSEANAGDAVVITTTDELDISRGDMVVRPRNLPISATTFEAYVCWMHNEPMAVGRPYLLMHTTKNAQARITRIDYLVDVDTMHRTPTSSLSLNDIGRVEITVGSPLFFDSYLVNSATGSFILIDPHTNLTVGAGMIRGVPRTIERPKSEGGVSTDVVWQGWNIPREQREARNGHRGGIVWLTGLSGAGKTTIAREVERQLFERGCQTMLLDGDNLRHGLSGDLGFSPNDRTENIRRAGEVARLFFEQGNVVLAAFVSPYRKDRQRVRGLVPPGRFIEVHVSATAETLRARDPKGLYVKAGTGQIADFTGMSAPYEVPDTAEVTIDTNNIDVATAAGRVIAALETMGLLRI